MAGVKDGIWKRGNNWYNSVKVNGRRRVSAEDGIEFKSCPNVIHSAICIGANKTAGCCES